MHEKNSSNRAKRDGRFVPALEAVHLISSHVGGDAGAKTAIVERLKDCSIGARAWWIAFAADVGRPYIEPELTISWDVGSEPPTLPADYWQQRRKAETMPTLSADRVGDGLAFIVNSEPTLGGGFWRNVDQRDIARWDWTSGFFLATTPRTVRPTPTQLARPLGDLPVRVFALGVEFNSTDVLKIVGAAEPKPVSSPARGGRPVSDRTPPWVAELVLLQQDEGIETWSANKVVTTIADRLAEKGLPELSPSSAHKITVEVQRGLRASSA